EPCGAFEQRSVSLATTPPLGIPSRLCGRLPLQFRGFLAPNVPHEAHPCDSYPASSFLRPPSRGSRGVLRPSPPRRVPFGTAIAIRLIGFAAVTWALTRNATRLAGQHASPVAQGCSTPKQQLLSTA